MVDNARKQNKTELNIISFASCVFTHIESVVVAQNFEWLISAFPFL